MRERRQQRAKLQCRPSARRRTHSIDLVLLLASAALWSCGGPGNTGRKTPDPSVVEAVPWLNGVTPAVDANLLPVIPPEPVYPPIALGMPDPGSQRTDCTKWATVEMSSGWLDTFEADPGDPASVGLARSWSAFDDLTKYSFHAPGEINWYTNLAQRFGGGWGMPAEKYPGPSCDGKPNDWVMHYRGGLFRQWGGGMSHVFWDSSSCQNGPDSTGHNIDFCPPSSLPGDKFDSAGIPLVAKSGVDYAQFHSFIDASSYDGVAFWARRGPEGDDRLLVTITDVFTSDRMARENQTLCRRVRACRTQCQNQQPCSPGEPSRAADPNSPPVYRCFDPQKVRLPTASTPCTAGAQCPKTESIDLMYPRCGPSACSSPETYKDLDFDGKSCRPYSVPDVDESEEYCWDEGDPPPPGRDERCLDGWQSTVQLALDWQFYTVPFSEMHQGGFGKMAPFFDLKAIDTIAFGFIVGWDDVYIDNVTLYRQKK